MSFALCKVSVFLKGTYECINALECADSGVKDSSAIYIAIFKFYNAIITWLGRCLYISIARFFIEKMIIESND